MQLNAYEIGFYLVSIGWFIFAAYAESRAQKSREAYLVLSHELGRTRAERDRFDRERRLLMSRLQRLKNGTKRTKNVRK